MISVQRSLVFSAEKNLFAAVSDAVSGKLIEQEQVCSNKPQWWISTSILKALAGFSVVCIWLYLSLAEACTHLKMNGAEHYSLFPTANPEHKAGKFSCWCYRLYKPTESWAIGYFIKFYIDVWDFTVENATMIFILLTKVSEWEWDREGKRTARRWSSLSVPVDSSSNMSSSHTLMFAVLNCFFCVKGLQASEGHQTFAITSWTFNRNADVTCCHINITSICRPQSCSIDSRNELVWSSEGGWTEVWSVLTGLWNPVRKTERADVSASIGEGAKANERSLPHLTLTQLNNYRLRLL